MRFTTTDSEDIHPSPIAQEYLSPLFPALYLLSHSQTIKKPSGSYTFGLSNNKISKHLLADHVNIFKKQLTVYG